MNWWVTLSYAEPFLILTFAVTGCISISAFSSLLGIPLGIMSSTIGLKFVQLLQQLKRISW